MQKAIIVYVNAGEGEKNSEALNHHLSDGWKVVAMEAFHPSMGGNNGSFTLGSTLVILEK